MEDDTKSTVLKKYPSVASKEEHQLFLKIINADREYFEELKRVSENQIIWGGNYFELPIRSLTTGWEPGSVPMRTGGYGRQ